MLQRNKININYYKELSDLNNLNDLDSDKIHFLEEKDILKYNSKSKKRFFRYVGLIIFSNGDIISVLPKCVPDEILYDKSTRENYSKEILETLIKYNSKKFDEFSFFNLENIDDEKEFNLFSLYDFIINDFLEYGLFKEKKNIYEENGDSEIDWEYTLNVETGYLNKNKKPLYLNYYNFESIDDNNNIVQEIHKFFLNEASKYFRELSFLGIEKANLNFYTQLEINIENKDKIEYLLKKVLRRTFNQRKIKLLKLFLLLLNESFHSKEEDIKLYGTKFFHTVWEDICKVLFNNLYSQNSDYHKIIKKFTKPNYEIDGYTDVGKPLLPDVVTIYKNFFLVIDAKYYNIYIQSSEDNDEMTDENIDTHTQDKIIGYLPASYDVLKQFVYMECFIKDSEFSFKAETRKNIFIIPGKENKFLGKIKMEFFKDRSIEVYLMNFEESLNFYQKNKINEEMLDLILNSKI